jgi:hypothetical protein
MHRSPYDNKFLLSLLHSHSMGRCLYSFSPSRGQYSPLVSGNVTSVCSAAPSPFAEQPANLHSGFLATRGGDPPATAFGVDVITCQWADCCAAFDDFSMFISHVQEGVSCLLMLGSLTPLKCLNSTLPPQITQACTNPTTPVNGSRALIVAFLRLLASHLSLIFDRTLAKRRWLVSYLVSVLPSPSCCHF